MMFVVAPYLPLGSISPNLGAARKLEVIIGILSTIDEDIVLINSSQDKQVDTGFLEESIHIGALKLRQVWLPSFGRRSVSKFLNIIRSKTLYKQLSGKYGRPNFIWIYNGYAFECSFARHAMNNDAIDCFLEFEDWHFSRSRGFSFKPIFDWLSWRIAARRFKASFCVNSHLTQRMRTLQVTSHELPGIVATAVFNLSSIKPDICKGIVVGYFGGLTIEKGVDIFFDIIPLVKEDIRYIVCGTGELLPDLKLLENKFPTKLAVFSGVDVDSLLRLYSQCNVILNPHKVSAGMLDGLFPSKVLEAIGSGRVVISTQLPEIQCKAALQGVQYFDGSHDDFVCVLDGIKSSYRAISNSVENGAFSAVDAYGESSVKAKILSSLTNGRKG